MGCSARWALSAVLSVPTLAGVGQEGRRVDPGPVSHPSHFHLDHCGALPYFSEMVGYDGPIYMTHPTQAICPILLEDYRKIAVDKKGEANFFTSQMIKDCMKKVVAVHLHQTVQVLAHGAVGHALGPGPVRFQPGVLAVCPWLCTGPRVQGHLCVSEPMGSRGRPQFSGRLGRGV